MLRDEQYIIICDVDDTVAPSTKPISDGMADMIDSLIVKGYEFVFISGSTVEQIKGQISNRLTGTHHVLGNSGAEYHVVPSAYVRLGEEFDEKTYPDKVNKPEKDRYHIYKHLLEAKDREKISKAVGDLVVDFKLVPMTTTADQIQDRGGQITLSVLGRLAPEEYKRKYDPDKVKRTIFVKYLREKLGDAYDIRIGGTTSIDIGLRGRDKKDGIERFLSIWKREPKECIFIGDHLEPGGNDHSVSELVDCIPVDGPEGTLEILKEIDAKKEEGTNLFYSPSL